MSLLLEMLPPSRPRPRSRPHSPNQLPSSSTSTHNLSPDSEDSDWSLPYASHSFSHSRPPSTSHFVDSPLPVPQDPVPPVPSSVARSSPDSDENPYSESSPPRPHFRLPKASTLPDPSQFPDPYPFRPHQYLSSGPPTLSSGGSSIASTRSSAAYTSSGSALASGDYSNHVHIASNDDDQAIGVGITSDDVVHLANQDPSASTSVSHSRAPIDQSRWSQSYSGSIRSRSSLVRSNSSSGHDNGTSGVQQKPLDLSWQPVDERDEVELISDPDTEDTDLEVEDLPEEEQEEERTSAIVIAEEGRGLIVRGDGLAVADLVVQPGMSHVYAFFLIHIDALWCRDDPFTHWVFNQCQRFAGLFDECLANHQHYIIGPGHFRQFSRRSPSRSRILRLLGRTECVFQSPSSPSSFHSPVDIPPRPHSGLDWAHYAPCPFERVG
jgi:hypothetical protein